MQLIERTLPEVKTFFDAQAGYSLEVYKLMKRGYEMTEAAQRAKGRGDREAVNYYLREMKSCVEKYWDLMAKMCDDAANLGILK